MTVLCELPVLDSASRRVRQGLDALSDREPIVLVDDRRRNGGAVLVAGVRADTPRLIAFLVRHTSGFLCVALPESHCDRMALPRMYHPNTDPYGTAYHAQQDSTDPFMNGRQAC